MTTQLTSSQFHRFENHMQYAKSEGVAFYESNAPSVILEGDDRNAEDAALLAQGLLHRYDGYYTFTQTGWDYARYLKS